jgi:hypothetical protein
LKSKPKSSNISFHTWDQFVRSVEMEYLIINFMLNLKVIDFSLFYDLDEGLLVPKSHLVHKLDYGWVL